MEKYKYISGAKTLKKAFCRTIGYEMYWRRHQLQLTLDQVCTQTGLSYKEIDRLEIGRCDANFGTFVVLAEYYKRYIDFTALKEEILAKQKQREEDKENEREKKSQDC